MSVLLMFFSGHYSSGKVCPNYRENFAEYSVPEKKVIAVWGFFFVEFTTTTKARL